MRIVIECLSTKNIINIINKEIEEKLVNFRNKLTSCIKRKDSEKYREIDIEFHKFLINLSDNELVIKINENCNVLLLGYIKGLVLDYTISYAQHLKIIDSILEKDIEKATDVVQDYINAVMIKVI